MSYRYRGKNKVLIKSIGLVMAVTGVGVLIQYMPSWMWPLLAGIGLICFGWVLFCYPK